MNTTVLNLMGLAGYKEDKEIQVRQVFYHHFTKNIVMDDDSLYVSRICVEDDDEVDDIIRKIICEAQSRERSRMQAEFLKLLGIVSR